MQKVVGSSPIQPLGNDLQNAGRPKPASMAWP